MYHKRTYTPSVQNLDNLPLANLAADYEEIRSNALHVRKLEHSRLKKKLEEDYVTLYNATHEAPYEGSFEELNLDAQVAAKLPNSRGLGQLAESQIVDLVNEFGEKFAIKKNPTWFFGQMLARFAQLPLKRTESGLYSAKALLLEHIRSRPELTALWLIAKHPTRSTFLDKQTDPKHRSYSSLVPLIMSAYKNLGNIPYEMWDRSEISGIVEPNLASIMLLDRLPEVGKEELLEIRTRSLTPQSGKTAGMLKPATTTYTLYTPAGTPLSGAPMLLRIMMCQTWCAHPVNRTNMMILDPINWDNMPDSLIDEEVLVSSVGGYKPAEVQDWAV